MMKFKEIRSQLNSRDIDYWESDNGQRLYIRACYFSNKNFFDYGEAYKKPRCDTKDKFLKELFNDPRIVVLACDDCGGCSGW